MTDTLPEIAREELGLTGRQAQALLDAAAWQREDCQWFAAFWINPKPGNTFSILADKGLLERRSDPTAWGRAQYRVSPAGLAIRTHILTEGRQP